MLLPHLRPSSLTCSHACIRYYYACMSLMHIEFSSHDLARASICFLCAHLAQYPHMLLMRVPGFCAPGSPLTVLKAAPCALFPWQPLLLHHRSRTSPLPTVLPPLEFCCMASSKVVALMPLQICLFLGSVVWDHLLGKIIYAIVGVVT